MAPKISIIIPVYNGFKTLARTVKSVFDQGFQDFELIIVDDCSTDKTAQLILELSAKDNRIIPILKTKNEKPLLARLDGVKKAKADWICFLDADDVLLSDALEKLYNATDMSTDVVLGSYCNSYDKYNITKSKPINIVPNKCIEGDYLLSDHNNNFYLAYWGCHSIFVSSCARLYKKSFFKSFDSFNIRPMYSFDDTLMNLIIFEQANKIRFIKTPIIIYYYGGGTSRLNTDTIHDLNELYKVRSYFLHSWSDQNREKFADFEYINTIYQYFFNGLCIESWNEQKLKEEFDRNLKFEVFKHAMKVAKKYNSHNSNFFKLDSNDLYPWIKNSSDKIKRVRSLKRKIGYFLSKL